MEFESVHVIKQCNELIKQAFPNYKEMNPRQLADLQCLFLGGYASAINNYHNALGNIKSTEGAVMFMSELAEDARERGKFAARCMINNDYSHEMFKL